jgi:heterodisulfide reductase subunit C
MIRLGDRIPNRDPIARMERKLGHPLERCYQCGKCSAGCPAAYTMSAPPNRIIRYLQLGQLETALAQNSYWVCSSCETCSARCPREIEVKEVMELLRHEAFRAGRDSGQRAIPTLHRAFLNTVALFGRLYEPALIMLNNLTSGHFFKDVPAVPGMLAKGKIKFLPSGGADMATVRRIYAEMKKEVRRGDV